MHERILEIIALVMTELRRNKNISDIDIDQLQNLGYSNVEISTAFSWLVDRIELSDIFSNESSEERTNSIRILQQNERDIFTKEALGELIQMMSIGILQNEHIEVLLEKAMIMGLRQLDVHQLRYFIANAVFNSYSNTLPAQRYMLTGNETIN